MTRPAGLRVVSVGSASVQDMGRPGWAHLGVPVSGALDRAAAAAANRSVGNDEEAAVLEVVLGTLSLAVLEDVRICITGAPCPGLPHGEPFDLRVTDALTMSAPTEGMRSYVAVAGGFDFPRVLGSASWDSLSHLGTAPLRAGDELVIGSSQPSSGSSAVPAVAVRAFDGAVRLWPGPRTDWFDNAMEHLTQHVWTVSADSNRVGLRLDGAPMVRTRHDELPSEGLLTGAVQVPHDGHPIVMLADHPTTGGYPVVAVVDPADLDSLAQVRPGDHLRFRSSTTGPDE